MGYLAVDKDGKEWIYRLKPRRDEKQGIWQPNFECYDCVPLPQGSIERLIVRKLTWKQHPKKLVKI